MCKLNKKYEVNRSISKSVYLRHSPSEINTINIAHSQIYINIPRKESVICLLYSCLDVNFDVIHAATNNRDADDNDIKIITLGPIGSFSNSKLTTRSGKPLEDISHAYIVYCFFKVQNNH